MGFFSDLGSAFSDFVSDVVDTVVTAVPNIISKVKEVAVNTINWLADEAEIFVGDVQKIWQAVKPHISKARVALTTLASLAPWPIVKVMALGLERALAFLENIESHPLMAQLKKAIDWVIKHAKDIKEKVLNNLEIKEAEARAQAFKDAMQEVPAAEQPAVRVAALINSYMLVRAKILKAVNAGKVEDFNQYLRVRAAQKLLAFYEKSMTSIETLADVNADMIALMDISACLISSEPSLTIEQARTLDQLTTQHFGKSVIPFVFEEMILAWNVDLEQLEANWKDLNKTLARDKILAKRLTLAKRLETLTSEEQVVLNDLLKSVESDAVKLEELANAIREKCNYVYASEGFLQLLEKGEDGLTAEDKGYMIERSSEVGRLIIDCAQNQKKWDDLSEEQQSLIVDFANIFEEDCRARTEAFTLVEVAA